MRGWIVLRALGGQCYPTPGAEVFATHEAALGYVQAQQESWQDRAATRPTVYLLCEAITGKVGMDPEPEPEAEPEPPVADLGDFASFEDLQDVQAEVVALKSEIWNLNAWVENVKGTIERGFLLEEEWSKMRREIEARGASVAAIDPGELQRIWQELARVRAELQDLANRVRAVAPAKPANGRRKVKTNA